jgi:hypothetical protein
VVTTVPTELIPSIASETELWRAQAEKTGRNGPKLPMVRREGIEWGVGQARPKTATQRTTMRVRWADLRPLIRCRGHPAPHPGATQDSTVDASLDCMVLILADALPTASLSNFIDIWVCHCITNISESGASAISLNDNWVKSISCSLSK